MPTVVRRSSGRVGKHKLLLLYSSATWWLRGFGQSTVDLLLHDIVIVKNRPPSTEVKMYFNPNRTEPNLPLLQLLELSALCLRCEVGDLLEDESCWSIFVACYNLYNITTGDKAYGLLRDTAGNTLAHIVLMLFSCPRVSRASTAVAPPPSSSITASSFTAARNPSGLDKDTGGGGGRLETSAFSGRVSADSSPPSSGFRSSNGGGGGGDKHEFVMRERENVVEQEEPWPSLEGPKNSNNSDGFDTGRGVSGRVEEVDGTKEEESVLVRVMRFLSLLSDPRSNGSAECVLSLSLINIALEAGGGDLGRIPALVRVMRGDLCKHLLQNSQTEDLNVLSLTLRVVFNLFNSIKDHLKIQLEVFLTRLVCRLPILTSVRKCVLMIIKIVGGRY